MFISYFDEAGDDGYPARSSELFVLSNIYMHESYWKQNYEAIHNIRRRLKEKYNFPVKEEWHTKQFLADKNPYHGKYSPQQRKEMLIDFCEGVASLNLKSVSVVIDKNNINRPAYDVLKNALTYSVQRIENDLSLLGNDARFLIITDEGRVPSMQKTTRLIQRMNYIPSMYNGTSYRKDIKKLIEDPLPKNSKESYFVQITDMISFLMLLYSKSELCNPKIEWGNRIKNVLSNNDLLSILTILKPILNLKASRSNEFGVVYYPK